MGKTLLVSLVSDQTIPNVQLIKQLKAQVTDYLFVTTKGMEDKGTRKWIESTCGIPEEQRDYIIVEEFSIKDIEEKLNAYDFKPCDKIIVNLTGGTKTMTLVASDFFKKVANEIYYVTGRENEYVKLFPQRKKSVLGFSEQVTLKEYLSAYGFSIFESSLSGISFEQTCQIYLRFLTLKLDDYFDEMKYLSLKRSGEKCVKPEDYYKVSRFVETLSYKPIKNNQLTKKEVKYLTGDWFEEFIGFTIKNELDISDENILIGATLTKETPAKVKNDTRVLLNDDPLISGNDSKNEMDVMFIYNGIFYSIECKSSIIAYKIIEKNGEKIERPYNILGETIYKSDSLKNRFGLYPKTAIITLTDFVDYCHSDDNNIHHNKIREMENYINRANLSNIKLIDKKMLISNSSLFDLIKN